MVPAVAVKPAEVAPDATVIAEGTVNAATLLVSVTVMPPVLAACDNVTEQEDAPPELRLVGLQDTWLTVVDAVSVIDSVCELLL
jgi:hypothetical protein